MTTLSRLDEAESKAEYIRSRLTGQPQGLMKTPDEMIDDLEWAKHGSGQIALVLKQVAVAVKDARRVYAEARAHVLQESAAKSTDKREAEVTLLCAAELEALEQALVVQDFAKNVARSIEQTGSMTQTQASLVRAQMQLAGTGRGA